MLRPDPVRTLGTMYDDVVYLSLGKAIALGHGYRSEHLVGAPVHEKFPPGLPAVYALLWAVAGTLERTVRLALLTSIAAVGAATGLLWYYSRRALGNGAAVTALLVVQPLIVLRSVRYFSGAASEPWFVLCWAGALLLAWRVAAEPGRARLGSVVGLGLLLAAAGLVRTQGVVLVPAVALALLIARVAWRTVGVTMAAALVPLLAWRMWHARMVAHGPVASQSDQLGYSSWIPHESVGAFFGFIGRVLRINVPGYVATAVDVLAGWNSPKAYGLVAIVAALMVAGLVRARRRHAELWLTLAANGAIILLWPYLQDRFLVALLPFIGLAAAYGLEAAIARLREAWRPRARWLAVGGIAAASFYLGRPLVATIMRGARGAPATADVVFSRTFQQRSSDVTAWVREHTDSGARVMTELGAGIYMRTGRRTVIGIPEEPFTGPTVLDPPGRYVAERILADSVTHIIAWSNMGPVLAMQAEAVARACPTAVRELPPFLPDTARLRTRYFEVRRDEPCLRAFVRSGPRRP